MRIIRTIPEEIIPSKTAETVIHTITVQMDTMHAVVIASEDGVIKEYSVNLAGDWQQITLKNQAIIKGFFKKIVDLCFCQKTEIKEEVFTNRITEPLI